MSGSSSRALRAGRSRHLCGPRPPGSVTGLSTAGGWLRGGDLDGRVLAGDVVDASRARSCPLAAARQRSPRTGDCEAVQRRRSSQPAVAGAPPGRAAPASTRTISCSPAAGRPRSRPGPRRTTRSGRAPARAARAASPPPTAVSPASSPPPRPHRRHRPRPRRRHRPRSRQPAKPRRSPPAAGRPSRPPRAPPRGRRSRRLCRHRPRARSARRGTRTCGCDAGSRPASVLAKPIAPV